MVQKLCLFIMLFLSASVYAQNSSVKGVVIDFETAQPVPGAKVSLQNKDVSVVSGRDGGFVFKNLSSGQDVVNISVQGYESYHQSFLIGKDESVDLGSIPMVKNSTANKSEENIQIFDESMLDDDDNTSSQSSSYLSGASDDTYLKAASYNFSPMRFNLRGYDQSSQATYINGVNFTDQERGRFNYSSLGGLNDAFRNKDIINGIENSSFAFGSLGGVTNINTNASAYAPGTKVGLAYTNRAYMLRGTATHSTGLMSNGWAFTASATWRWANEGRIDGTFYNSVGYFLSAEKILNDRHRIALVTYGAPTKRSQSAAVTQEVYDLAKSGIYYNPYWGYQNGDKRNSRVVNSYDPSVIANWIFDITEKQKLKTGIGFHYSKYSNTALGFYNAADPRPDYYRNLPSYQYNDLIATNTGKDYINYELMEQITQSWKNDDPDVTQINWNSLYHSNYLNNIANPDGSAKYVLEERHNDLMEAVLNSVYTNEFSNRFKLIGGIEAKYSKGMHYKTMNDLLGGNQWIDIDQFAERDFTGDRNIIQNDLRNPNRKIKEGDIFGYDYDMNVIKASAFLQNEWTLPRFDAFYAARLTYTTFQRDGHMENGRATAVDALSYGKGKSYYFVDPSVKAGFVYKINGHHRLSVNGLFETRAPFAGYSYIAPRVKDTRISGLKAESVYSWDINYMFSTSVVKGRISAFQTFITGATEGTGYYHDEFRTFVNHTLYDVNKRYQGVEAGITIKLNNSFSVDLAGTFGDYRYTNNAKGVMSAESGVNLLTGELPTTLEARKAADVREMVYTKDLHVANGPQTAASITLDYFHPKMWFANITLSYFDKNYLDFSPSHFTEMNYYGGTYMNEAGQYQKYSGYLKKDNIYATDADRNRANSLKEMFGTQEKLKGGFMLDASVGKVIYLNNRKQSLNFNLSFNNILNNEDMVTGGYQQGRIGRNNKSATRAIELVDRYPNKYYYAWGFNCFLNVGYKF